MADEVGAMAGKVVGKAALKAMVNPSTDIVKAVPQGIIELALRGVAVVSLVELFWYFCVASDNGS